MHSNRPGRPYHRRHGPPLPAARGRHGRLLRGGRLARAAARAAAVPRAHQCGLVRPPARGGRPADLRDLSLLGCLGAGDRSGADRHRPHVGLDHRGCHANHGRTRRAASLRAGGGQRAGDHARPGLRRRGHPDGAVDLARDRCERRMVRGPGRKLLCLVVRDAGLQPRLALDTRYAPRDAEPSNGFSCSCHSPRSRSCSSASSRSR